MLPRVSLSDSQGRLHHSRRLIRALRRLDLSNCFTCGKCFESPGRRAPEALAVV
jgi:hypothetical protein